ncbi:MAG TPA: hypothetical protein VIT90_02655 [Lysobacter sp.]
MTAAALLDELATHSVTVERHGDRLLMRAPKAPPAELVDRARNHKSELLEMLPDLDVRPVLNFTLPDDAPGAIATALGQPGQTPADLAASLRKRWPSIHILPRLEP